MFKFICYVSIKQYRTRFKWSMINFFQYCQIVNVRNNKLNNTKGWFYVDTIRAAIAVSNPWHCNRKQEFVRNDFNWKLLLWFLLYYGILYSRNMRNMYSDIGSSLTISLLVYNCPFTIIHLDQFHDNCSMTSDFHRLEKMDD